MNPNFFSSLNTSSRLLLIILCSFILFQLFLPSSIWWDSAVYVGMGKYIGSSGESGLWEDARPLVLPVLLSLPWFLGIDLVLFGQLLMIAFASACLILVYLLGRKFFSSDVGLLATFFTATSLTFFELTSHILTEIPSLFFFLLGFYLFHEREFFWSGLFFGMALATRYFALATFIILLVLFFFYSKRKDFAPFLLGISIVGGVGAFVLFFLYENPFHSFLLQLFLSKETGLVYQQPWWFYVVELVKQNPFVLTVFLLPLCWKQEKKFVQLVCLSFLPLLIYSLIAHKEMRFLILSLPFLFILISYIIDIFAQFQFQKNTSSVLFFVALVALSVSVSLYSPPVSVDSHVEFFQSEIENYSGDLFVSNPLYALYSDHKVSGLVYYPLLEGRADAVFVNSCDLEGNSAHYRHIISEQLAVIEQKHVLTFEEQRDGCLYRIFTSS